MKRKQVAIGLVVALGLGAGGWALYNARAKQAARQETSSYVQQPVRRGSIRSTITGTGPVAAVTAVNLKAAQAGTAKQVLVKDGDKVTAGQVLVVLDSPQLQSQLEQAQNDLASLQQQLARKLNPNDVTIQTQKLKVESAEATYRQRQADQAALTVKAPISGVVTAVPATVGSDLSANSLIMTLYDDSAPTFVANVPQEAAGAVKAGAKAQVTINGFGTREGTVRAVLGSSQSAGQGTVQLAISLPETPGIRPGMTGSAQVEAAGLLFQVKGNGTVQDTSVQVKTQVAGKVAQLAVREGARVTAGDLLASLTNDQIALQVAQAANDLAVQQQNLTNLINPETDPDGTIADLQRKIATAQATLAQRQEDVASLQIKAPVSGTVSGLAVTVGDKVSANQQLMRVADYGAMQIVIGVDELDIAKVQVGQSAQITLDALPGKRYRGKVTAIAPEGTVKNDIATFSVTVQIEEPQGILAGMTASAEIVVAQKDGALLLPAQAVHSRSGQSFVSILKDGRPQEVEVQTGIRTATEVEILSGLQEGQQVIVTQIRTQTQQGFPGLGGANRFGQGGNVQAGPGGGNAGGGAQRQNGGTQRQGGGGQR
jgi:HlyD family secretion protein